jgi:hypothetical protein
MSFNNSQFELAIKHIVKVFMKVSLKVFKMQFHMLFCSFQPNFTIITYNF